MREMLLCFRRSLLLLVFVLPNAAGARPPDSLGTPVKHDLWEFSVAGFYYTLPSDDDVLVAVARADRGSLHLEARYNYEDLRTGSVFAGWTLSAGESLTAALTPMAGMAFGSTTGIIPALEMSLGYAMLDFYAESEYLFDVHEKSGNFFYSWLELGVTPNDLLRVGLTAQRTRIFQSPLELDRGLFAQVTPELGSMSVYAFNLSTDYWFLVVGLEIAW